LLSVILAVLATTVGSATINALAVSPSGEGFVVPINVTVIGPGDGLVYVAAIPSTGGGFGPSAQVAYYVTARLLGINYTDYTVLIRVLGDLPMVGGPSASAYISAAIYSILSNSSLRDDAAMTGIILPDGLVGPVGGVRAKVEAAARRGIHVVAVPIGQFASVPGVRVVEVGTIEQAITVLTNRSIKLNFGEPDWGRFNRIGRFLYERVAELYRQETGRAPPRVALDEAEAGHFYTAASLIYQALIRYYNRLVASGEADPRVLESRARRIIKKVLDELRSVRITASNIDMVVAVYRRVNDVERMLESGDVAVAYVRAITLRPWLDAIKRYGNGQAIDEEIIRGLSRLYLEFAKAMYAYVSEIVGPEVAGIKSYVNNAIDEAREGKYLLSLADSIEAISRAAAVLWSEAIDRSPEKVLELVRSRALNMTARAQKCGLTGVLPLSYVEFGDYYSGLEDYARALSLYLSASIYATAIGDALCGYAKPVKGFVPVPTPERPMTEVEVTPAMVLVPLILLITFFAVALLSR